MQIDRQLNLTLAIDRGDAPALRVWAQPISLAAFKTYYRVLSKTFSRMYEDQVSFLTGPKTASLTLEEIARETERGNAGGTWWDGVDGVENGLMAEIRRLCIVFAPADGGGYTQLLLPDAVTKGLLSERELLQLESALVYGLSRFLDDVDNGRCYWRDAKRPGDLAAGSEDAGSVVHSVLDWAASSGFGELCASWSDQDFKLDFPDACAYRQRHQVGLLRKLAQ